MEAWVQIMLNIRKFLIKNLIAQLRLVYDNPESSEVAIKKLNDRKQNNKPFLFLFRVLKKRCWKLEA